MVWAHVSNGQEYTSEVDLRIKNEKTKKKTKEILKSDNEQGTGKEGG